MIIMSDTGSLLDLVISFLHNQKRESFNNGTLISLLALSNLLGIVAFLNSQTGSGLKFEDVGPPTKMEQSGIDLQDIGRLLGPLMDGQGGEKINPATLMTMAKMLSSHLNPPPSNKDKKTDDKAQEEGQKGK